MRAKGTAGRAIGWQVGAWAVVVALGISLVAIGTRAPTVTQPTQPSIGTSFLSGDYVSFSCAHSEILLATDIVCHDQTNIQTILPATGNPYSVSMTATIDYGWTTVNGWRSFGDACLGGTVGGMTCPNTSSINPVQLWEVCGSGSRCAGSVTLSVGNLTVIALSGENSSPGISNWSETLSFTVPKGEQHEVVFWAIGALAQVTITLPSGMTTKTQFGNSTGIAIGSLAAGTYNITASCTGALVNSQSIVVYGVVNDTAFAYEFKSASQAKSLSMSSGAEIYLGALSTGGANITAHSLTTITEEAPATGGGVTELIGSQATHNLSFQTNATLYGLAGVGITPP